MQPDFYFLSSLNFSRVRVTFEAIEPLEFSFYKGFAFRGQLGKALRDEVCEFSWKTPCNLCPVRLKCPSSVLYHSFTDETNPLSGKFTSSPHPYIIIPTESDCNAYQKGETFAMEIILIGLATIYFPLLSKAIFRVAQMGISKTRGQIMPVGIEFFKPETGFYQAAFHLKPPLVHFGELSQLTNCESITLEFQTPLRLKEKGIKIDNAPDFNLFAERLAQRLALLSHIYCGAQWTDTTNWFQNDSEVEQADSSFTEVKWKRKSETQKRTIECYGITGSVTWMRNLTPWLSLLSAGEWLHVGLLTTFGYGKYNLREKL